ncbi:hypothetical protein POSPLADRAFT_1170204 [Postia placenta MAD-698-R-SB12]|uniref:MI domain-containing protein n=1 Tax=Postia placenta MAD-698-R-SB12 TaxID=670580 RepID=A0A1X6MZB8_9APHY|nr:hypothetical protein POSPLADRAFT_1170204 [Postia placenta MAD-698-R-SB12]OSX61566.1 hypothetical protein POSPLADRAFT_1170204 [Postia placenta MAD-698-R-SB12]
MSKSSTASAPKIQTQLPQKSAWLRGPPQSSSSAPSPRSQSPAPNQGAPQPTHSRRPSTLGQGVSFKDGVAGSSVTFGSIDDVTAPISSSPAAVPPIKSEGVKTFGSVPATSTSAPANIKPSTSSSSQTPSTQSKFDVKKLFQAPSAPEPSSEPPAISSPSTRSSQLPQSSPQTSHAQPSPMGHAYQTFVPGGLRPSQNGAQPGGPPRSPVYPRQIPNGQVNGANGRPNGAQMPQTSGPGPMPTAMPSPRMGHPHGGQPAGLPHVPPPVPVPGWPGYYAREEEERKKAEEEERVRKEKEEEERVRKEAEAEAEERKKKEEEERLRKEEEEKERVRKEEEDRQKAKEEEEERLRREEEERAAKEAEEAKVEAAEPPELEPEEGEVQETEEPESVETEEAKDAPQDKASTDKASLRIDTALTSPEGARRRPGHLDLSLAKSQTIPQPLPSALATARIIEDLGSVSYPDGIQSPKVELNVNAKQGKFRYDRDFLLQFMAICKEKPDSLPPLDAIGLEPADQSFPMSRGGSGRRSSTAAMPPPASTISRQASVGLGISGYNKGSGPFNMGQFATPNNSRMTTSDDRFAASQGGRSTSMSGGGPPAMAFGRPTTMVRSSSQGGPGGPQLNNKRTRSKRGVDRAEHSKANAGGSSAFGSNSMQQGLMSLEPVAPLEQSANRWTPQSIAKKPQQGESESDIVDRKVRSLLNKLTMERFDSISDQIISWANKSEKEKDGRTLIQVIRLVFEKATDEAAWSEMYARLCRKMMEQISANVQDEGIKNNEGKPIAGGQLFRKYLLNRCQEDFERGWVAKEATAVAAATKATEDRAAKAAADTNPNADESALYSEEYYAAQKAKRQGLGLIKFIGELFKLQMLTERIMHECIKKLLGNVENPEEEEIESLCKLLTTVGQSLDTPKARAHMDVYFSRMKELCKNPNVNSRMQFMLQDIIELRARNWVPRNQVAAPTTIAAIHEQAAKEKAVHEKEAYQRTLSMSRGGSRRGGERGDHSQIGPDGWAVAGGNVPRAQPKAGDLSNFGKIQKAAPMTFGPTSVFAGKKENKSRESTMTRAGSQNMFSKLMENPELATEAASSKSSRPPSRKPSVDFGAAGAPEVPLQRRKLQLLPRTLPKSDETKADSTPATSEAGHSEDEGGDAPSALSMTEAEANVRTKEDSKEFFSIRDLDEAEVYFTKLPTEHRFRLVDKLVTSAIESKEADAQLVASLFSRALSRNSCSPHSFEEGFMPTAEILDDIAIDAPKAFDLMAIMMKGAGLDKDEERRARLASKSMDSDKLLALLS